VRAALKFLGLTEPSGKVTTRFSDLIKVHGTAQWPMAVKECVLPAYQNIIGDLPIDKATSAQLDAKFKDKGVSGQVLEKAVRSYLHALRAAGVKYSSYLTIRTNKPSGGKIKKRKQDQNSTPVTDTNDELRAK